jgi:hypothetical protein
MGMVLSNDKKRREFLEDPKNWEPLPSADNFVRISKLLYKEHMWLHIELWQTSDSWNYQQKKIEPETGWTDRGYYKINEHTHALGYPLSISNIIDELKEIDKKEKQK